MCIKNIKMNSFTVFSDIDISFSKGINLFIGQNGTGKTHLLKALYFCSKSDLLEDGVNPYFKRYFGVLPSSLISNFEGDVATIELEKLNSKFNMYIHKDERVMISADDKNQEIVKNIVFIPAKEILTNSKGFVSLYDERDIPFSKVYRDIISKSTLPNLREIPKIGDKIIPILEKIMDGKVLVENDTFYILKNNGNIVNFAVEAEGIKKIALLWQLIMNKEINENTILFWDEPESNINPSLISDIVEILLELSRQGVQIFLSTHDYFFSKYFEVLKNKDDEILFHALYNSKKEGVKCESKAKFSFLDNNKIIEEKINIYKREISKVME